MNSFFSRYCSKLDQFFGGSGSLLQCYYFLFSPAVFRAVANAYLTLSGSFINGVSTVI
jgi:hypothetical protein